MLSGMLILDKPHGISSMGAVANVRRRVPRPSGVKRVKVGHSGTLDPLATGVLVIAIGSATRTLAQFMNTPKRYETVIDLSAFTATDDLEGQREDINVAAPPPRDRIAQVLRDRFAAEGGMTTQRPPAYSAMKVAGRRAYTLVRQGAAVDIPKRPVAVHSISVQHYTWPMLTLNIHCGKGFYVRALARELGQALGTGGHCTDIRRTAVGPFVIEEAHTLEDLPDTLDQTHLFAIEQALSRVAACET